MRGDKVNEIGDFQVVDLPGRVDAKEQVVVIPDEGIVLKVRRRRI